MLLRVSVTFTVLLGLLASLVTAQANVPITGVRVPSGSAVPLRKNINQLYKERGPAWDLYIAALNDMYYSKSPNNQASFFQVAGIHGRPFIEWNGAGRRNTDGWAGYCPHGESLFLPWHRPYMVLFEQRLVETAIWLAKRYPAGAVRDKYVKAAETLRAPYWDWVEKKVPPVSVHAQLTIRVPKTTTSGTKEIKVDNPLRYYKFPREAINQQFGSFSRDPEIYKCRSPQSYPNSANEALGRRSYKGWVYDAFTRSTTFEQFASTGSSGISLEQIHNAVHWDGSCGFQFLNADYSAFDPLFMLHHANVDRLWAYFQFIKPQAATLTRSYRGQARFSDPSGTTIGPNSPLRPFFRSPGNFHTPETVKSIKNFGYTYEGLEYWRKSDEQMRRDATTLINRWYAVGPARPMLRKRTDADGETTRYFAQVSVNVEELERPCEIGLYANVTSVGNFIVMGQPASGTFFGKFSLDSVADPEELKTEETRAVISDLLASLRVEIKKHDGTITALSDVPSLKIELENVDVLPPETNDELPEYNDAEQRQAPKIELEETPSRL